MVSFDLLRLLTMFDLMQSIGLKCLLFCRKWPTPVSLCPVQRDPPEGIQVSMPVWDPDKNPRDAKQLMPILTPAYPSSKFQDELYSDEVFNILAF